MSELPSAPNRERKSWRQSPGYQLALFALLILLLGGILYLLKTPASTPAPGGASGSVPARAASSAGPMSSASPVAAQSGADLPGGQSSLAAPGAAPDAVALMRERLQALTGQSGTENGAPGAGGARPGSGTAELRSQSGAGKGASGTDAGTKYGVELPSYDRAAFAARQRELEALRARTMADLAKVAPNDPEGMMRVVERMSQGLQAQGLPNIVDMPKMEAMLRGARRLNELNTALVTEMGRAGGGRPEEMARLSREIRAVQATIPNTVYNLDTVGRLMRGERP